MDEPFIYEIPQVIIRQDERQISPDDLALTRALRPFTKFNQDTLAGVWQLFSCPESSLMSSIAQLMDTEIIKKIKDGQVVANADYELMVDDDAIILPSSASAVMDGFNTFLTMTNDFNAFEVDQMSVKLNDISSTDLITVEIPTANCLHVSSLRTLLLSLVHVFYEQENVQLQIMDSLLESPLNVKDLKALDFLKKNFDAVFSLDTLVTLNFKPGTKYEKVLGVQQMRVFQESIKETASFSILRSIDKYRSPLGVARYRQLSDALLALETKFPGVSTVLYFYLFKSRVIDLYDNAINLSFDDNYTEFGAQACQVTTSILLDYDDILFFDNSEDKGEEEGEDENDNPLEGEEDLSDGFSKPDECLLMSYRHQVESSLKSIEEIQEQAKSSELASELLRIELKAIDEDLLIMSSASVTPEEFRSLLAKYDIDLTVYAGKKKKRKNLFTFGLELLQEYKMKKEHSLNGHVVTISNVGRQVVEMTAEIERKQRLIDEKTLALKQESPVFYSIRTSDNEVLFEVLKKNKDMFDVKKMYEQQWQRIAGESNYAYFLDKLNDDQEKRLAKFGNNKKVGTFLVNRFSQLAIVSEMLRFIRMNADREWDERSKEMSAIFPVNMKDAFYQQVYSCLTDAKQLYIGGQLGLVMKAEYVQSGLAAKDAVFDYLDETDLVEPEYTPGTFILYDCLTEVMIYKAQNEGIKSDKTWLAAIKAFDLLNLTKIQSLITTYEGGVLKLPMPYNQTSMIALTILIGHAKTSGKEVFLYPSNNPHEPWFYFSFKKVNNSSGFEIEFLLSRLLLSWTCGVINRHNIFVHLAGVNSLNWEECRVNHLYELGFVPYRSSERSITYKYQAVYKRGSLFKTSKRNKAHKMLKRMEELANLRRSFKGQAFQI